jgi:hypothetical protein
LNKQYKNKSSVVLSKDSICNSHARKRKSRLELEFGPLVILMDQLISIECSDVMKEARVEKILIFYFIFCNI